jgi:hypothetical protein
MQKNRKILSDDLDMIFHCDNAPANTALSVKQFMAHKSITEMEHMPCSHDLAPNDFWPFP